MNLKIIFLLSFLTIFASTNGSPVLLKSPDGIFIQLIDVPIAMKNFTNEPALQSGISANTEVQDEYYVYVVAGKTPSAIEN